MNFKKLNNQMQTQFESNLDLNSYDEVVNNPISTVMPIFSDTNLSPTCVSESEGDNCHVTTSSFSCDELLKSSEGDYCKRNLLRQNVVIHSAIKQAPQSKDEIDEAIKGLGGEHVQFAGYTSVQFNLPIDCPKFNHGTERSERRRYQRRNSATAEMIMSQGHSESSGNCYEQRNSTTTGVRISPVDIQIPPIGENGRRFKRRNSATAAMIIAQGQSESTGLHLDRRNPATTGMNLSKVIVNSQISPISGNGRRFKRRNSASASMCFSQCNDQSTLDCSERTRKRRSPTIPED